MNKYKNEGTPQVPNHVSRIIGGEDAPVSRHNYTVAILGETIDMNDEKPFCGGSLIAPNWVITAAHCDVRGEANKVVIGRYDFDSDDQKDFEEINIISQTMHPKWYSSLVRNDYDFMLLELEEESMFTPIKIDDGTMDLEQGRTITALGWGRTGLFGEKPGNLQTVDMEYESFLLCQLKNIFPVFQPITERIMCASQEEKGVCFGDEGGPLILKGNNATEDVLIGVASSNVICSTFWSNIFSRVGSVVSWIKEHVEDVAISTNFDDEVREFPLSGIVQI